MTTSITNVTALDPVTFNPSLTPAIYRTWWLTLILKDKLPLPSIFWSSNIQQLWHNNSSDDEVVCVINISQNVVNNINKIAGCTFTRWCAKDVMISSGYYRGTRSQRPRMMYRGYIVPSITWYMRMVG